MSKQYGDPFSRGELPPSEYHAYTDWFDKHDSVAYETMLELDSTLIGDPETVITRMRRMYEVDGWQNFMLTMNRGGALDQQQVLKVMELMATVVMPEVRKALE